MKYERLEDWPVWQTAIELGLKVYRLTRDGFFDPPGDLRDQLRRAAIMVVPKPQNGSRTVHYWHESLPNSLIASSPS